MFLVCLGIILGHNLILLWFLLGCVNFFLFHHANYFHRFLYRFQLLLILLICSKIKLLIVSLIFTLDLFPLFLYLFVVKSSKANVLAKLVGKHIAGLGLSFAQSWAKKFCARLQRRLIFNLYFLWGFWKRRTNLRWNSSRTFARNGTIWDHILDFLGLFGCLGTLKQWGSIVFF